MPMTSPLVRPMRRPDLPSVVEIQHQCYAPAFHEPMAAFESKWAAAPETCWVAQYLGQVCAYLVCLPVQDQALPALHAPAFERSAQPNWLYLHDLAIGPAARGTGLASQLISLALNQAHDMGLTQAGLIAVQDSASFWRKFGFVEDASGHLIPPDKLASFGAGALFMRQALA